MAEPSIPTIDVGPLFGRPGAARTQTDRAIMAAATGSGFMTISGLPPSCAAGKARRAELLRIFTLSEQSRRRLLRRKFDAARANVYRGWFPLQGGGPTYKEGIDIGPDLADAGWQSDPADPLTEATPLPSEAELPGWRQAAADYYRGMEQLGATLMRAIARGFGLAETTFDAPFRGGISTLRLIRYPLRAPGALGAEARAAATIEHQGRKREIAGGAHVDSGFVTLLAQDGVEGLQARGADGRWLDVPPLEGTLAVNFGGLLERWSGGRIKATEHRVVAAGRERCSIPFFYEPRVDALIAPLPGGAAFAPFTYGDHLWAAMSGFVEFQGLEHLRKPRPVPAATPEPHKDPIPT
jgi:isopenicillin N synthase-like dioxygenase